MPIALATLSYQAEIIYGFLIASIYSSLSQTLVLILAFEVGKKTNQTFYI